MHMYSYSPTSRLFVSSENFSPAFIIFELNVSPKSAELVTVCTTASALVHSTTFPFGTCATSGS